MQSIISAAAFRAFVTLARAVASPSSRVAIEEQAQDWVKGRKGLEFMAYGDGSGLEVAYRGRLWVLTTEARSASLKAV